MPRPVEPVAQFAPEILMRARDVRVLFLDVDGVLTDGSLFFGETGEVLKRFHTLDGHGIKLLMRAGIVPVVITGRDSPALRLRLQQLGVQHAAFGTEDKLPAAQRILYALGLHWHQAAVMGDDWPDLPLMQLCAFACAPATAHAQNLALADWVTPAEGGQGAVRQLCDLLLTASGQYRVLLMQHLAPPQHVDEAPSEALAGGLTATASVRGGVSV